MAVSFVFWLSSMSTLVNAWRFYPPPGPFELKVPYVARPFTCRFQVFPFYGDSSVRLECGAASVCNDAVDNGLCLSPGRHFRTRSSRRFSSWLATPSVEPHETRTGSYSNLLTQRTATLEDRSKIQNFQINSPLCMDSDQHLS